MDKCLRKTDAFPIGPRALAAMIAYCGSIEAGQLDPSKSTKAGFLRLLDDAYEFHQYGHEDSQTTTFKV